MKTLSFTIVAALTAIVIAITAGSRAEDTAVAATASETVCEYHNVPTNLCTRCDSSLIPAFKAKGDWCVEHHLPESQCDLCNHDQSAHSEGDGHDHSAHAAGDGHDHASVPLVVVDDHDPGTAEIDWCTEHRVPESECTKCNPQLVDKFKASGDWCGGHGIPESHCYLCNPTLTFAQETLYLAAHADEAPQPDASEIDWCAEHRVPKSECTKCNPQLVEGFKARNDWCGGHGVPESHCYLCNPTTIFPQEAVYRAAHADDRPSPRPGTSLYRDNSPQCETDQAVIQLASIQTPERAGLTVETVFESPASDVIDVPAEVEFDATAAAVVTSPVGGTLAEWVVDAGSAVREGQILAYVESIEAATQKAEYAHASAIFSLAEQNLDRKQSLRESGSVSVRELQEAEAEFLRAQADMRRAGSVLRMLRLSENEMQAIAMNKDDDSRVPLRARQSGTLVEQTVSLGALLDPGSVIGMVSRTEKLWVEAQVRERDLSRLRVGQPVTISIDGNGWKAGNGRVVWIADGVDEKTRMGRVRIEAEQNGVRLRAHQYVRVQIETTPVQNSLLVPADAVQWEGCCNIVFVQETPDRYRPRKVKVEFLDHGAYAVSGLIAGEKIVSRGSYLLKTELMKSSLGAGCCGVGA